MAWRRARERERKRRWDNNEVSAFSSSNCCFCRQSFYINSFPLVRLTRRWIWSCQWLVNNNSSQGCLFSSYSLSSKWRRKESRTSNSTRVFFSSGYRSNLIGTNRWTIILMSFVLANSLITHCKHGNRNEPTAGPFLNFFAQHEMKFIIIIIGRFRSFLIRLNEICHRESEFDSPDDNRW